MFRSHRVVYALAALFLGTAVAQFVVALWADEPLLEAVLDLLLIALPGALLLGVGAWLSGIDLELDLYGRVVGWCLAGVGVMFVFLSLRAAHPRLDAPLSLGSRAIVLAIGSVAGLAIGVREAQAIKRSREVERRNAELTEIRATLEQRNRELERTRSDLEHAVRELERSNRRLEEFAHAASHDLQEPLRTVTSYLHLLERRAADELDEESRTFVELAVGGAGRMLSMIDGLLAYSRVDTAGEPFAPVAVADVVDGVLVDLEVRLEERDAVVEVGDLPRVVADERQLRQVLQNLIANAVDYSDGPPRITVDADRRDEEWVVSVGDEGVGVEPEHHERIFEPFQRLHGPEDGDGSGIGLALCREVVHRHGGEIWVDSEPDEGTTVSFTLPRREAGDAAAERSHPGAA